VQIFYGFQTHCVTGRWTINNKKMQKKCQYGKHCRQNWSTGKTISKGLEHM